VAKNRTWIPPIVRTQVLAEFNHRCAICGADRPHLHHLDEDPSNHDLNNLIPLCPNCHLTDQHNPAFGISAPILRLFRLFKDPVILSSQFQPLYRRLAFLDQLKTPVDHAAIELATNEVCSFVASLNMGEFYARRIADLLDLPGRVPGIYVSKNGQPSPETVELLRQTDQLYLRHLQDARSAVLDLAVELLRYQGWPPGPPHSNRSHSDA